MNRIAELTEKAAEIADRMSDPADHTVGLAVNDFVAQLRTLHSTTLAEHREELAHIATTLGATGERIVSWLARHPDGNNAAEEAARAAIWRTVEHDRVHATV